MKIEFYFVARESLQYLYMPRLHSCHMPCAKIILISSLERGWLQNKISIEFELRRMLVKWESVLYIQDKSH